MKSLFLVTFCRILILVASCFSLAGVAKAYWIRLFGGLTLCPTSTSFALREFEQAMRSSLRTSAPNRTMGGLDQPDPRETISQLYF
jgi:hypothetical protein